MELIKLIAMEAKTEREILIEMKGDMRRFGESLERVMDMITETKDDHEHRIMKLEKFQNQLWGALILVASFDVITNIAKLFAHAVTK